MLRRGVVEHEAKVRDEEISLSVHMERVGQRVRQEGRVAFTSFFEGATKRNVIVGVFLAILELLRHHGFRAEQTADYSEISCSRRSMIRAARSFPSQNERRLAASHERYYGQFVRAANDCLRRRRHGRASLSGDRGGRALESAGRDGPRGVYRLDAGRRAAHRRAERLRAHCPAGRVVCAHLRSPVRFANRLWKSALRCRGICCRSAGRRSSLDLADSRAFRSCGPPDRRGIPMMLLEQNAVPGRATSWLAPAGRSHVPGIRRRRTSHAEPLPAAGDGQSGPRGDFQAGGFNRGGDKSRTLLVLGAARVRPL